MKFVKFAKFAILEDFCVLYYIKVTKFIKFAIFGIYEDFHVLYYIKVTKFVKLAKFGILEVFRVLYYIKVTKLWPLFYFRVNYSKVTTSRVSIFMIISRSLSSRLYVFRVFPSRIMTTTRFWVFIRIWIKIRFTI